MNCKKTTSLMCEYVEDDLAPSLRCLFEEHIRKCPACKAELEAMEDMIACLGSLNTPKAPMDFWQPIRVQLAQEVSPKFSWLTWIIRPAHSAPVFAATLLLAGFVFWPSQVEEPMVQKSVSIPEYRHYLKAHSGFQQQQPLNDPDVAFVAAELETVSLAR